MKNLLILIFATVLTIGCQSASPTYGDIYEHLLTRERYKVDLYGVGTLKNLYHQNPSMVMRIFPQFRFVDTTEIHGLFSAPFVVLTQGDLPTKMELLSVFQKEYRRISP